MNEIELRQMYECDDVFVTMYLFPAEQLIAECGLDGETAVRLGVRHFGVDRGLTNRNKQLALGLKINMKNYFTYARDLPADPRFKRDYLTLTPQERISRTLKCPMYDVCEKYGLTEIGRIYCEEFHFAGYGTYAYGYTQVNLARTLTQGDDYCSFSVLLRPENLPEDLKPICFEEYDPYYQPPDCAPAHPSAKEGYNSLSLRLFSHMFRDAVESLGDQGKSAVVKGLEKVASQTAHSLRQAAADLNRPIDWAFADQFQPFQLDTAKEPMWSTYDVHGARQILQEHYCNLLLDELGLHSF